MKGRKINLAACIIALGVTFGVLASNLAYADSGTYYPAVSPDVTAKVDAQAKGEPGTANATAYYPAVSPDITAKVDNNTKRTSVSTFAGLYFPAVSPRM